MKTKTIPQGQIFYLVGFFKYFFLMGGLFFLGVAIAPLIFEAVSITAVMISLALSVFAMLSLSLVFWRYRLTADFLFSECWIYRKKIRLSDIDTAAMVNDLLILKMRGGRQEKLVLVGQEFRALARILVDKYGSHTREAQQLHGDLLSIQRRNRISYLVQGGFWVAVIAVLYYLNRS